MNIKIKKLTDTAIIPKRETIGAAGADLHADIQKTIIILPNHIEKIPTGLSIEVPENYVALIFGRSGMGINHGIVPANAVGVIDEDYRGGMQVGLLNNSNEIFKVNPNDRIAQLVIVPYIKAEYIESNDLSKTERGNKGFGSTGK